MTELEDEDQPLVAESRPLRFRYTLDTLAGEAMISTTTWGGRRRWQPTIAIGMKARIAAVRIGRVFFDKNRLRRVGGIGRWNRWSRLHGSACGDRRKRGIG